LIDEIVTEGPTTLKLIESESVLISGLLIHNLVGSIHEGNCVILLDLHEGADFSIENCQFKSNILKQSIMFQLESQIKDFTIENCLFENETLSNSYIFAA
jgi:hypothetical protein